MAEFDAELSAIKGPYTRRKAERLHDRTHEESAERLKLGTSNSYHTTSSTREGGDLHHVARCIEIGATLEAMGEDMKSQVDKTKVAIADYGRQTAHCSPSFPRNRLRRLNPSADGISGTFYRRP
jgi:hypothetical protein